MANLTSETLLAMMRELHEKYPPPPPNPLLCGLFRPMVGGERIYEAPPPRPKIQCRDIKFDNGTSILSPEFRAQHDAWLLERFGYEEDFFKDKALIISGMGIMMSKRNMCLITNLTA